MLSDKVFFYLCSDGGSDLKVHNDTITFICCVGMTFDTNLFGSLYQWHNITTLLSHYVRHILFLILKSSILILISTPRRLKERREEMRKNRASSIIWFQKISQKTN